MDKLAKLRDTLLIAAALIYISKNIIALLMFLLMLLAFGCPMAPPPSEYNNIPGTL